MVKNLKEKVKHCLEKYPETRNSDIKLTNAIWYEYYRNKLFLDYRDNSSGDLAVRLKDLYNLPREDEIKRIRAYFQNDKKLYLPTSWEVARRRKWKEEEWRSIMGYNPELRTI